MNDRTSSFATIGEWSEFTAGVGILKIACAQNVPPSTTVNYIFAHPPDLCTEIVTPSLMIIQIYVCMGAPS